MTVNDYQKNKGHDLKNTSQKYPGYAPDMSHRCVKKSLKTTARDLQYPVVSGSY